MNLVILRAYIYFLFFFFFFQAEDGIRDHCVTGVQTCALPISRARGGAREEAGGPAGRARTVRARARGRSEEHTSELQSHSDLVCRLLLEKKKKKKKKTEKTKQYKNTENTDV